MNGPDGASSAGKTSRRSTELEVDVLPDTTAEAVRFLAFWRCTGDVINVDGGVKDAYPRSERSAVSRDRKPTARS
jgi:hypothetical protein